MIKIAFFDIDGTLIYGPDLKMPQSTLEGLKELRQKGIKSFISTGRSCTDAEFIKKYYDFDGMVCCNGQYCIDLKSNEVIHKQCIPKSEILNMYDYVVSQQERVEFLTNKGRYILDIYTGEKAENVKYITKDELMRQEVLQVNIFNPPSEEYKFKEYCPNCSIVRWSDDFADVMPIGGGKDKGIEKILEHLKISKDEAIAFGDAGNDICMLEYLPNSVAMGQAGEGVKKSAKFVTKPVSEDGIYYALKTLDII